MLLSHVCWFERHVKGVQVHVPTFLRAQSQNQDVRWSKLVGCVGFCVMRSVWAYILECGVWKKEVGLALSRVQLNGREGLGGNR